MVYMFSIMNYVVQAEMNIYLLWDVRKLIETRKYDHIDGGIKVSCDFACSLKGSLDSICFVQAMNIQFL